MLAEQDTKTPINRSSDSEQDEPGYYDSDRSQANNWFVPLMIAASLPLLDGFYLSFLTTGLWQEPAQSVAFGLNAFSGAACVVTAMQLKGSLARRLAGVVAIYSLIAAGSTTILAASPFFVSLLPANLNLFTAVFLIGLALQVSGEPLLQHAAKYLGWTAAVKAMIVASFLHGMIHGLQWRITPDMSPLSSIILAVASGFCLTAAGVLLGYFIGEGSTHSLRPMRTGATISILFLGLSVLGLDTPKMLVLAPLLAGIGLTIVVVVYNTTFSNKR